jgi:hypothetical protein
MPRRLLALSLLLTMETGCPHTWRKGGSVDMMLEKQMWEKANSSKQSCRMTPEEWDKHCKDLESKPDSEQWKCPKECLPISYSGR